MVDIVSYLIYYFKIFLISLVSEIWTFFISTEVSSTVWVLELDHQRSGQDIKPAGVQKAFAQMVSFYRVQYGDKSWTSWGLFQLWVYKKLFISLLNLFFIYSVFYWERNIGKYILGCHEIICMYLIFSTLQ